MKIEQNLKAMGFTLKPVAPAVAQYIPSVQVGNLLFLAGTTGERGDEPGMQGKLGADLTNEQGYQAARLCGLAHLGMMKAALGDLDRVERIVRLIGYVNSAPGWREAPWVLNGESDLYIALWGDKGRHARAALYMHELTYNMAVETEVIVQVKPGALAAGARRASRPAPKGRRAR
jgi:enamine deaminase RidA (YjgF/YER057c/UK114 family)